VTAEKFYVQNFGCRATQADGAAIESALRARGLTRADNRAAADVVVVNTCTVTASAEEDARQLIRRTHRENPAAQILVTGCYAQRAPGELAVLPGVSWVVGNSHQLQLPDLVPIGPAAREAVPFHGQILVGDILAHTAFLSAPLPDSGQHHTRPNLKIQEGCHNHCSFCVIPSVRGPSRSAPAERVLDEVRALAARYREVVLTGINLGRWGRDLPGRPRLAGLLRRLLAETDVARLRLSSVEPLDWTDELLEVVATSSRMARHIHAPLQSGSDRILRRMYRRYRARHYADRLRRARRSIPAAAIGADVLVGFPGETDADFEATLRLIEELPFTYLHVFTYSARPGTPAADWGEQVPAAVKKERNQLLREVAARKGAAFRQALVGQRLAVLTLQESHGASTVALSDNYVRVLVPGRVPANQFVEVEAARVEGDFLAGRL
jgi:threonylcarbamoyladenosine tRNA methylthiotransferase MtaB